MSAGDANLRLLLSEIGIGSGRHHAATGALFIAAFEISFIGLAVAQALGEYALGVPPVAVAVLVWGVWTCWHSWLFPRNRLRYVQRERAYRTAFARDIYPWVTLGFCQMWRPLFNGDTVARLMRGPIDFVQTLSPVAVITGAALGSAALVTMISAIRSIGIANAAFVPEFREPGAFVPVERGIYAHFPHPLFWSGIVFSCGLAVAIWTPTALLIAAVNLVYGFCYGPLERRRLGRVFGVAYTSYTSRVAAWPIPGVRSTKARAGRWVVASRLGRYVSDIRANARVSIRR